MIGLQSTGEARTLEQLERDDGELTDFVSTAKYVFRQNLQYCFFNALIFCYYILGAFYKLWLKNTFPRRTGIELIN